MEKTTSVQPPLLVAALEDIAAAMRSDGFTLNWTVDREHHVSFAIDADDVACAECLVPRPVLEAMLGQALEKTGFTVADIQTPVLP